MALASALIALGSLVLASAITKVIGIILFILLVVAGLYLIYVGDRLRRSKRGSGTGGPGSGAGPA